MSWVEDAEGLKAAEGAGFDAMARAASMSSIKELRV
jgi:hypothetical protein